jgi:hypothetical protein
MRFREVVTALREVRYKKCWKNCGSYWKSKWHLDGMRKIGYRN